MATPKPRVKLPKTASAGEVITIKTLISHDMESVFTGGHRVTLLYQGHIEASAPRDEFVQSENPRVREFLRASGVKIAGGG